MELAPLSRATENDAARRSISGYMLAAGDLGAEEHYRKAIELDPDYCDAMDNLGQILRAREEFDEAIQWYQRSIEANPANIVPRVNMGVAYRMQGKLEEALDVYEEIARLDPDNPEGHFGMGQITLDMGDVEAAIPHFEQAEILYAKNDSPWIADVRLYLGACHLATGDCAKALTYLQQTHAQMPDDATVNAYLGMCYLCPETEDKEQARKYLERTQELGMEVPQEVWDQLED